MRNKYEEAFDAIDWDVHRDNPKFRDWDWPTTPPGAYALDQEGGLFELILRLFLSRYANRRTVCREACRQGTALRGLRLFHKVLHTHDHQKLVKRIIKHMTGGEIEIFFKWSVQEDRRENNPLECDRAEARGDRLTFFCDDVLHGPSFAWVIIWRGRYSNKYGEAIPTPLKRWGYVFWDVKRLLKTKDKETLVRTWEAERGMA